MSKFVVEGNTADGSAVVRNIPVLIGGVDGSGNVQTLLTGTDGSLSGGTLGAGTAVIGVAISPAQTGVIYYGTTAQTPANAIGTVAASQVDSTGTNFPAGVATKIIRVVSVAVVCSGAMTVQFNTKPAGVGTAITPAFPFATNGGFVLPLNQNGWFDTSAGDGLTVTTGAGGSAMILLKYIQFTP